MSACLSQWQRARQHEGRAAAGNAHCRLHMTRGSRKVWSDCKEVQRTCCSAVWSPDPAGFPRRISRGVVGGLRLRLPAGQ